MSKSLVRKLKSYEFLNGARRTHGASLSGVERAALTREIDGLFVDILTYSSDNPRITLTQVRFLLGSVVDMIADEEKADLLRVTCQRHLDRLESMMVPPPARPIVADAQQYRYLDSLTDRVAVVDKDYRYVFTNKANAAFHGKAAEEFVGKPNWKVVGEKYFELSNKSRFDQCYAGRALSVVLRHPLRGPSQLFAASFDPIKGPDGQITGLIVISRDVSALPIPPEFVAPEP